jgi:hypothetical protein
MIELWLGFFSMQHGTLLRWDSRSGKTLRAAPRKMHHDSFLHSRIPDHFLPKQSTRPLPLAIYNWIGNDARTARSRGLGTDVVLVDPPVEFLSPKSLLLLHCLSRSTMLQVFQEVFGEPSPCHLTVPLKSLCFRGKQSRQDGPELMHRDSEKFRKAARHSPGASPRVSMPAWEGVEGTLGAALISCHHALCWWCS